MGTGGEIWYGWESPGFWDEQIGHGYVITTSPSHPQDVPSVDYFATFSREIGHQNFWLAIFLRVAAICHYCRHTDPFRVIAVADEGRPA